LDSYCLVLSKIRTAPIEEVAVGEVHIAYTPVCVGTTTRREEFTDPDRATV